MYCSTCGTEINAELNYCNRCGARVDKLATIEKPARALGILSAGIPFIALGGLGLTIGLIAILLNNGVVIEAIVMLALAFLVTVFGMTFLTIRQISQMSNRALPSKEKVSESPLLNQTTAARLEEPRRFAGSVTENTTRTLEKEAVK